MKKNILAAGLVALAFVGVATAGAPGNNSWFQHPSLFPETQVLGAGDTINADACGGVKRITATAARTTSTSYTIGTLGNNAGKEGCVMDIINVPSANGQSYVITLDDNASFATFGNADIVIGTRHSLRVIGMGSHWVQLGTAQNNKAH